MNVLSMLGKPANLKLVLLAEFRPGECLGIAILLAVVMVAGLFRLILGPSHAHQVTLRRDPQPYDANAHPNMIVISLLLAGFALIAVYLVMLSRAN
jgi:hypothetical protein